MKYFKVHSQAFSWISTVFLGQLNKEDNKRTKIVSSCDVAAPTKLLMADNTGEVTDVFLVIRLTCEGTHMPLFESVQLTRHFPNALCS